MFALVGKAGARTYTLATAMIRWCAYCQTYQGESAPFDDYGITHTICPACFARGAHRADDPESGITAIRELFGRLTSRPRQTSPAQLLAEGEKLGLSPVDLLVGVLQPVLYEVGERWSRGEASVADEHAISRAASVAVELLLESRPELVALRQARRPEVLLTCAPGNTHAVGLQLVEFFLLSEGVPVYTILPGLPADEIVELTRTLEPKALGISVAMPEQVASVCEIAKRVHALPDSHGPVVLVGGFAVRGGFELPPDTPARTCFDFREIPALLAVEVRSASD